MVYQEMFFVLEQYGAFNVFLPFILIFTVTFAILRKIKILGDKKQYDVAVALVMGLTVVGTHVMGLYPPNRDPVAILNQSLPQVALVVIVILMALLVLGMLGKNFGLDKGSSLSGWIGIVAFGIVIYIFGASAGWWHAPLFLAQWLFGNRSLLMLIVVILVFALVIYFITADGSSKGPDIGKGFAGRYRDLDNGSSNSGGSSGSGGSEK
jgi:uncharacterized membrane protein YgcG